MRIEQIGPEQPRAHVWVPNGQGPKFMGPNGPGLWILHRTHGTGPNGPGPNLWAQMAQGSTYFSARTVQGLERSKARPGWGTPGLGLGAPSLGLGPPSLGLSAPSLGLGTPSLGLGAACLGLGF